MQERKAEETKLRAIKEVREKATQTYRDRLVVLERLIQEQVVRNNEQTVQLEGEQEQFRKESGLEMRVLRDKYELQFKSKGHCNRQK